MERADVVIIGSGFAGASTAWHLSRTYPGSILMLEKEAIPGAHASGRNASLVLQSAELPEIRQTTTASREFYFSRRAELGFRPCGSLLLGRRDELEVNRRGDPGLSEFRDPAEIAAAIPALAGHRFEAALWTPGDGVIEISALLQFYLQESRERGVRMRLGCEVREIRRAGRYLLRTTDGEIEAGCLVNAAGAWAPEVARMAGAETLPLTPFKRHLFTLGDVPLPEAPEWPFVWNLDHEFYFRAEGDGLLFSICDEERYADLEESVNPEISQRLAELILRELPALGGASRRSAWSCFRTKSSDGRFVIGWDTRVPDFFWVAGLGGNGVGSSWAVGLLASEGLLRRPLEEPAAFDPARFGRAGGAGG